MIIAATSTPTLDQIVVYIIGLAGVIIAFTVFFYLLRRWVDG